MNKDDKNDFLACVFTSIILLFLIAFISMSGGCTQKEVTMYGRFDGMHVIIDGVENVYDY